MENSFLKRRLRFKMSNSVYVITFKSDGTVHRVCDTSIFAKEYCKLNKQYEWECYVVTEEIVI